MHEIISDTGKKRLQFIPLRNFCLFGSGNTCAHPVFELVSYVMRMTPPHSGEDAPSIWRRKAIVAVA
jgi:hypothetical protein